MLYLAWDREINISLFFCDVFVWKWGPRPRTSSRCYHGNKSAATFKKGIFVHPPERLTACKIWRGVENFHFPRCLILTETCSSNYLFWNSVSSKVGSMAKIDMKYKAVVFILNWVFKVLFNCSSVTSSLGLANRHGWHSLEWTLTSLITQEKKEIRLSRLGFWYK